MSPIKKKKRQSRNILKKLVSKSMEKELTSFILKSWDTLNPCFSIFSVIQNPLEMLVKNRIPPIFRVPGWDPILWVPPWEYLGAGRAGSIHSRPQTSSRKFFENFLDRSWSGSLKPEDLYCERTAERYCQTAATQPTPSKCVVCSEGFAMFISLCISVSNSDN